MSTKTRGPYAGTAQRRHAIVEAALTVFGASGYRGGSMREIAQLLGVSHGTLLHHFGSKSGLLTAVLARRDELALSVWAPESTDAANELRGLFALIEFNQDNPGLVELHCILSAEATNPTHPAHDYFRARYADVVGRIERDCQAMADAGQLLRPVDPRLEAERLVALMDGLQVQWLLDPDGIDMVAHIRAHLAQLTDLAF